MFRGVHTLVFASGIFVLVPHAAGAQNIDPATLSTARRLGYAGVDAFQHGDYAGAAEKLERALRVFEAPSLGLWSARALDKLGRVVEAAERYRSVAKMKPRIGEEEVQRKAQEDAGAELRALTPRIPSFVVLVEGAPSSSVNLVIDDGTFQPLLEGEILQVNPGNHRLVVRSGSQVVEQALVLRESEHKKVVFRFPAAENTTGGASNAEQTTGASRPNPAQQVRSPQDRQEGGSMQHTLGWISVEVGGAAVVTGVVTGLMAVGRRGSLDGCNLDQNVCPTSQQSAVDSYNGLRHVSTIGFVAGGIITAGGAVLLLTLPKSDAHVAVQVSPTGVALGAVF